MPRRWTPSENTQELAAIRVAAHTLLHSPSTYDLFKTAVRGTTPRTRAKYCLRLLGARITDVQTGHRYTTGELMAITMLLRVVLRDTYREE